MEQALAKIRPHVSSSLAHQKIPATLLIALESTLKEQNTEISPTAYFAALLTTLEGTIQKRDIGLGEGDILPAELYILALIAPFVAAPVIRANISTLLSLTSPLFPSLNAHAPALRSQLSLYHAIFQALDRSNLEVQGIRQTFASVLQLCLDPRPKVRKKAADLVKDVLEAPPAPLARHPYAERVAEWVEAALSSINSNPLSRQKSASISEATGSEMAIHLLAFLRPIFLKLPPTSIASITTLLLLLPRLENPYLSQSVYSILSDLFSHTPGDIPNQVGDQISNILKVLLSSPPQKSDTTLAPSWIRMIGNAMLTYEAVNQEACANELGKVWRTVWNFLDSNDLAIRKASVYSLDILCRCFNPTLISSALQDNETKTTIRRIILQVTQTLDSLAYARSIPELLSIISALIISLRQRIGLKTSPTAAESFLLPLITHLGELRSSKGFEHKERVDAALSTAMQILGPEVLLRILPLNLEPSDREAGREPRAYLLPLLSLPHPSPLSHFVSYFVPLSERMFDLQQKAESEGRSSEAKVWSVLVTQVWSGLVGYCSATGDLTHALDPAFSQLLSQLLYGQPDLRPAVLKALKVMVDSNVAISLLRENASNPETITPTEAAENLAFLRTQVESWLAVLFNVFGSVGRDGRGMVGEVISVWVAIAGEQDITRAYSKVVELFKSNLASSSGVPSKQGGGSDTGSAITTTQDILILLLPHLSSSDAATLFSLCLSNDVIGGKDNGVQKRGYKILAKLVESGKVTVDAEEILRQLDEVADGLASAAKKDRFYLFSFLIPLIPSTSMHVIPSLIPEVVLGTKEPSEKARGAAFDVILSMGRKMKEGGIVKRRMIDGMDRGVNDASANVEELLTMVAGGLAGASPHMISATVTAISRLVFEFKDVISNNMHTEIFTTLLVFLSSANREIVKSVLGFIKLAIHTFAEELIRPHLKDLVPALLSWSHDHKNHFKQKVRHIFERMLRRFGWDEVHLCAGDEEAGKVLVNIKKRKERAKRKKVNGKNEGRDDEAPTKPAMGDAFEDVLYGSESELGETDDDEASSTRPRGYSKKKPLNLDVRLRLDDDEPMDLLQGAASRLTTSNSSRRRQPGQDAAHFIIDEATGKMVIDEEGASINEADGLQDIAGTAYRETITSIDGFKRGPNGQVKFNKDTRKRRRENEEMDDIEMADGETPVAKPKRKKEMRNDVKFGREFKAKKAGGDVKRGGVDPYAYVPLSQAAKKGERRGHDRIGIAGKRSK
ncbi:ribosomal RNA-processing protein 12 [Collybia nuda]|uniref:Ribosomal RNA-processing protein 12 n=1 Tax=Collybia nuda TaxID=64659 RepID=A0A9P5YLP5_9AGAR|nr:ribosomal RNA-processing protein 12 [Collybia nuda]